MVIITTVIRCQKKIHLGSIGITNIGRATDQVLTFANITTPTRGTLTVTFPDLNIDIKRVLKHNNYYMNMKKKL